METVMKLRKNWTNYELIWLAVSTLLILSLSVMWKDTLLGTISSVTGIISVVLCAKGKINYLYWGTIQCTTYGYIAYTYGLFGESILNLLVFLPANIITFFLWKKNTKNPDKAVNGEDVITRRLTKKQWMFLTPLIVVASLVFGEVLKYMGASQSYLDGIIVILSLFAQYLLTFRYAEQWLVWILINALTIILWVVALVTTGGNDYGVLVMWIAFLLNSIYGMLNWYKISKGDVVGE